MTTLGGGAYGSITMKQLIGKKYWTRTSDYKRLVMMDEQCDRDEQTEFDIHTWFGCCKYYGAEYFEEDEGIESLAGILAPYLPKDKYIDPVEEVRQIRDSSLYED